MKSIAQSIIALDKPIIVASKKSVNNNKNQLHFHNFFELYYLKSGERYHYIDDNLLEVSPGEIILFPPQTMHRSLGKENDEFDRTVIYFKPYVIISDELRKKLYNTRAVFTPNKETSGEFLQTINHLLKIQNSDEEFKEEHMKSIINLLLLDILNMEVKPDRVVKKNRTSQIINYINNNFYHDISLSDLSKELKISSYYLCREFKKETNSTIVDYIKNKRIMNAQKLFIETNKNVTEVASLTGFSNLTHFNRVFKEIVGMTPSKYRKNLKEA